jgi:hypothetical protein
MDYQMIVSNKVNFNISFIGKMLVVLKLVTEVILYTAYLML